MARCCGGSSTTLIQVGEKLNITGIGSAQDPYIISADVALEVTDNATFNLTLVGDGTTSSPWQLQVQYAATASIDDLPDVDTSAKANGKGLLYNTSTGHWEAQTVPTAAPGAISHGTSLNGDGSVGSPLSVAVEPTRHLGNFALGVGLDDEGIASLVRRFGNDLDRSTDTHLPFLNSVTMLDDSPGVQWYWTGVEWKVVNNGIQRDLSGQLLSLSGPFDDSLPITLMVRQVSDTTDAVGNFDVIANTDLAGRAGVVTCQVQETGAIPYKAVIFGNGDRISAVAYRLDDGTPLASSPVTATVTAYVY